MAPDRALPTVLPMSPLLLPAVSLITLVKSSLLAVDEAWLVLAVDAFWACSALVETGSPDSAGKPCPLPVLFSRPLIRDDVLLPALLVVVPLD